MTAKKKPKQEEAQPRSWEEIMSEARAAVQALDENDRTIRSAYQWRIGDLLLEAIPVGKQGGAPTGAGEKLQRAADDLGMAYKTVRWHRQVASKWPKEHRESRCTFSVHRALSGRPDRFDLIKVAAEECWSKEQASHEAKARPLLGAEPQTAQEGPQAAQPAADSWEAAKAAKAEADRLRYAKGRLAGACSHAKGALDAYEPLLEDLGDGEVRWALASCEEVKVKADALAWMLRTRRPLDDQLRAIVEEG